MSVVGGILRRAVPFQTVERLDLVRGNVEREVTPIPDKRHCLYPSNHEPVAVVRRDIQA